VGSLPTTRLRVVNGKNVTSSSTSVTSLRSAVTSGSVQAPEVLARHLRELDKAIVRSTAGARSLPFASGVEFDGQAITTAATVFAHNMGRPFRGYMLLRKSAALDVFEPTWAAGATYAAGAYVYPTRPGKLLFLCTVGGAAGASEPAWPTAQGLAIVDNATTWLAVPGDPSKVLALQGSASATADVFIY
jgi:hypothetical protein